MKRLLICVLAFAATAAAAGVEGTWKVTTEGHGAEMVWTLAFKVDGGKLTGEASLPRGVAAPITGGTVDGDNVSFAVTMNMHEHDITLNCKGKVSGDTIRLTVEAAGIGQTMEWTGKRVQ